MNRGLKLAHLIGLILFLGSILTFIIVSLLIEGGDVETIAFGRQIISTGTHVLTLPGLWILAVTGIGMGYKQYGGNQQYFRIKAAIAFLVILNTYLFVAPAVTSATELAARSLAQGRLLQEYMNAYMQESVYGGINVLLAVAAMAVGVWKIGAQAKLPSNQ